MYVHKLKVHKGFYTNPKILKISTFMLKKNPLKVKIQKLMLYKWGIVLKLQNLEAMFTREVFRLCKISLKTHHTFKAQKKTGPIHNASAFSISYSSGESFQPSLSHW